MNAYQQRLRDRTVPPSAHGARAYTVTREDLPAILTDANANATRIDYRGGTYTVADLQRATAREDGER